MKQELLNEVRFQTARSGGAGGQNVNKVETAVTVFFNIALSTFFTEWQKEVLLHKLANRINKAGEVMVKAQMHRTQQENKKAALQKLDALLTQALQQKKLRIATRPSRAAVQQRMESKQKRSEQKAARQKWKPE